MSKDNLIDKANKLAYEIELFKALHINFKKDERYKAMKEELDDLIKQIEQK
jgi:hypothetical protein